MRPGSTGWQAEAATTLRKRLGEPEPSWAAFVVDQPGQPRLAACAVGIIDERLGWGGNPAGLVGFVFNVVTDPAHRRHGYSRLCMEALLDWFRERGVPVVDLRTSPEGEGLYRQLGFARASDPAMRLNLS